MAAPAAPAAGAAVEGIAGLFLLLSFVVFTGLHRGWLATIGWLMHKIADWIDFTISLPFGKSIRPFENAASAIRKASDNVGHAFGYLALKSENGAVWFFHQARQMLVWTADEIAALAQDTWHGIDAVVTRDVPRIVGAKLRPITHGLRGIDATVTRLEHSLTKRLRGIDATLGRIERVVTRTLPHEIAHVGTRVGTTAKQLRRLARRTSALERATIGAGAVALVGTALTGLGLKWLKCPALGRVGRKLGCGGFGLIEEFLSTTFEALIVIDLCRFAIAAQRLAALVVPQLGAVLLVPEAVCLGGGAQLPSAHDSPKTTVRITLPSAHD